MPDRTPVFANGQDGFACVTFDLDWLTGGRSEQGWPNRRIGGILLPNQATGPLARPPSGKAPRS